MKHSNNIFSNLLSFLKDLKKHKIHFILEYIREETILVNIAVPGQRWEVEFCEDGSIKVERFMSYKGIEKESVLRELFEEFSD